MKGRVLVADRQKVVRLPVARLRALAREVLHREKLRGASLSLAFVDSRAMRKLNRDFLKHDFDTDVLAFRLGDPGDPLFGEVVVSTPYAVAEARRRNLPVLEEVARYVVHGILHLAGFEDHEPGKRKKMWKRQEAYLLNLW